MVYTLRVGLAVVVVVVVVAGTWWQGEIGFIGHTAALDVHPSFVDPEQRD